MGNRGGDLSCRVSGSRLCHLNTTTTLMLTILPLSYIASMLDYAPFEEPIQFAASESQYQLAWTLIRRISAVRLFVKSS